MQQDQCEFVLLVTQHHIVDGRSTERYCSNVWLTILCYVLYLLFCVLSFQNPLISQPENVGLTIVGCFFRHFILNSHNNNASKQPSLVRPCPCQSTNLIWEIDRCELNAYMNLRKHNVCEQGFVPYFTAILIEFFQPALRHFAHDKFHPRGPKNTQWYQCKSA